MKPAEHDTLRVEPLMKEIESQVRDQLRRQLLAHGGAREYEDPRIFESVERLLRRAAGRDEFDPRLLPELLSESAEWRLETHLRVESHRTIAGPLLVFVKRRLLFPLTRWLYEYSMRNFERQQRLNLILITCVEELAIENAALRRDLARLQDRT